MGKTAKAAQVDAKGVAPAPITTPEKQARLALLEEPELRPQPLVKD